MIKSISIILGATAAINLRDDGDFDFYGQGNAASSPSVDSDTNTQIEKDEKPQKLGLFNTSAGFDVFASEPFDKFTQKSDALVQNSVDQFTFSNFAEVQSTHLSLDLDIDFDKQQILGQIEHTMKVNKIEDKNKAKDTLQQVILDVQGLNILSVEIVGDVPKASLIQEESELVQLFSESFKHHKKHHKSKQDQENSQVDSDVKISNKTDSDPKKSKSDDKKASKDEKKDVKQETKKEGSPLKFEIKSPTTNIPGSALVIAMPDGGIPQGGEFVLRINYETTDKANAFSWLSASQTLGKKMPYLFTQCQALACRSVAPLQDTPAIKSTYEAKVKVPEKFQVQMSANSTGKTSLEGGISQFSFSNSIKVPSYLIALAVGDLQKVSLGNRVNLITEPGQIESAKKELSDLQNYLDKVEEWIGIPYAWGEYNMLVLPPAFPFGGMENPMLTFVSPTMITGDKSQVHTAIHEVAHSWTGNLVTCKTWEDFWLNEGLTVFIQRKITQQLYGKDASDVESLVESFNLKTSFSNNANNGAITSLHQSLEGTNPDAAKTAVPYEKGFLLLNHLEGIIGDKNFQQFMKVFVQKFSQKSATSDDFKNTFNDFMKEQFSPSLVQSYSHQLEWDEWLNGSGPFSFQTDFSTKNSKQAISLAEQITNTETLSSDSLPENSKDLINFSEETKLVFLDKLRGKWGNLDNDTLAKIDKDYHFTDSNDSKIKQRWYWLGIVRDYAPVFEKAHQFVSTQGKTENLQFIYQALVDSEHVPEAQKWLEENKSFYHKSTLSKIQKIVDNGASTAAAYKTINQEGSDSK